MTDTIDDRLDKVLKDLDIILGISYSEEDNLENSINRLIRFGFTPDEAKAFLENEKANEVVN